jgi:hypothetical protein
MPSICGSAFCHLGSPRFASLSVLGRRSHSPCSEIRSIRAWKCNNLPLFSVPYSCIVLLSVTIFILSGNTTDQVRKQSVRVYYLDLREVKCIANSTVLCREELETSRSHGEYSRRNSNLTEKLERNKPTFQKCLLRLNALMMEFCTKSRQCVRTLTRIHVSPSTA